MDNAAIVVARTSHLCSGELVIEPNSRTPSSVIRLLDVDHALVRHVDTRDDHRVPIADLTAFADGVRVRVGPDFNDSH